MGCVPTSTHGCEKFVAEWKGVTVDSLSTDVSYGLPEWQLAPGEYTRIHRFAVTQRRLFETMDVIPGAPQSIRRLGTEGVRIRIITHRLFIRFFHEHAAAQTVRWLDDHAIPYWDLCFMRTRRQLKPMFTWRTHPRTLNFSAMTIEM